MMEDMLSFDYDFAAQGCETQLLLNVDARTEQVFLEQIGGSAAREKDIAAFADQYVATHIGTLCFAGSDKNALEIWSKRCRALGLCSLLTVNAQNVNGENIFENIATDGVLLDCRAVCDYVALQQACRCKKDKLLYVLLTVLPQELSVSESVFSAIDAVIVCEADAAVSNSLPVAQWVSENKDFSVFAGLNRLLCAANGKAWYATSQIMNGYSVRYLSQGCSGLWLDGCCADLLDPDASLYDIYETCGKLSESVGAKRRHVQIPHEPEKILPGKDYRCTVPTGAVIDGTPVCLLLALTGAAGQDSIAVTADGNDVQYTGEPVIIASNANGRECENQCIPANARIFEYYIPESADRTQFTVCIHNNTTQPLLLHWIELSVNI